MVPGACVHATREGLAGAFLDEDPVRRLQRGPVGFLLVYDSDKLMVLNVSRIHGTTAGPRRHYMDLLRTHFAILVLLQDIFLNISLNLPGQVIMTA